MNYFPSKQYIRNVIETFYKKKFSLKTQHFNPSYQMKVKCILYIIITVNCLIKHLIRYCWVNNVGSCCVHVSSGRLTGASTPDNIGACSASWEGYNPSEFGDHTRLWPQQCWKSCRCEQIQNCCPTFRQSQNKRNVVGSKV